MNVRTGRTCFGPHVFRALRQVPVLLSVVVIGACGRDARPTDPGTDPAPASDRTIVTLAADLPLSARSAITGMVSVNSRSSGLGSFAVELPAGLDEVPVFALNSLREPVLMVFASRDTRTEIGNRSTASGWIRLLARSLDTTLRAKTIDSIASTHSKYGELLEAISAAASTGRSYATAPQTTRLAAAIATDVVAAKRRQAGVTSLTSTTANVSIKFPPLDIVAEDGILGVEYAMGNNTFVEWSATATQASGTVIDTKTLARRVPFLSLLPARTYTNLPGANGDVRIDLAQTAATRAQNGAMVAEGLIGLTVEALLAAVNTSSPTARNELTVELILKAGPAAINALNQGSAAPLGTFVADLLSNNIDVFVDVIGNWFGRQLVVYDRNDLIKAIITTVVGPIRWVDFAIDAAFLGYDAANLYGLFRDYQLYARGDLGSKASQWVCQRNGVLYTNRGCDASLRVNPSALTLAIGASSTLQVSVVDSDNAPVSNRAISFTSLSSALATVGSSGTVTGVAPGSTTIRVSIDTDAVLVPVVVTAPTPPNQTGGNTGSTVGDPHLRTFDGRGYPFMAVGDYVLNRSTVSGDNFQVQVRYRKLGTRVSVNDAFAAAVGSDTVNVYHTQGGFDVIINDSTFMALTTFSRPLASGGAVSVANGLATISWPDRSTLSMRNGGAYLHLPFARSGKVEGLLGNYDGNAANDVRTPAGMVVDAGSAELYGEFRRGWRIPFGSPTSLFKRGPDLYDANFPIGLVRLQDLDPAAVAAARVKCRAAGVVSQEAEDDCAFDIVVSGDDSWAIVARQFDPGVARVLVGPAVAYARTGQAVQFAAASQGLGNAAVRWTASGGTITSTGAASATFTAPSTPGTYTVTALSEQTATVTSSATVFVTAPNQPSGSLSSGQNHTGRISAPGEEDTWTFTASQSETIIVSIAETAGDADFTPWIRLYAPSGALVQDAWDNVATQHWRTAPESGTYRVVVGSRDGGNDATGDYRLVLVKAPGTSVVPAGDEGGAMTNGTNHPGALAVGDLDVWSFTAAQGEALMLSMSETRGDADFTPWLRLFAPNGSVVQDSWDNTATQHWRAAPATGTYTVVVGTRDGGLDATGDYKLILAKAPGSFVVPAGDEGGAMTNGENHSGRLTVGDLDLWTFTAAQGEAIMLAMSEVRGDADFTPWIRLFAPNGNLVQDAWDNTAVQHWRTAPTTGTYTLVVGTRDGGVDATGDYRLTLARIPGSFSVDAGDEGGSMSVTGANAGTIRVGDLDVWTFSATLGGTMNLTLSETGGDADFTPWMRVFGPAGALVGDVWDNATTQLTRTTAAAGTHYVVVSTRDGGLDAQGTYTLSITGTGIAPRIGPVIAPMGSKGPANRPAPRAPQ